MEMYTWNNFYQECYRNLFVKKRFFWFYCQKFLSISFGSVLTTESVMKMKKSITNNNYFDENVYDGKGKWWMKSQTKLEFDWLKPKTAGVKMMYKSIIIWKWINKN
jgi:hypothetical protein